MEQSIYKNEFMEPLSILAGAVTTIVLPKVLEKTGETIGEKITEAAIAKSSETVQIVCDTVQNKLQAVGTAGLLQRAKDKPTEQNIQVLEGELVSQMEDDQEFAVQLQKMIQQIQAQSPSIQAVLDTVRIKGNAEIGNIEQVSEGRATKQTIAQNLGVGGDLKMGDITQRN